MVAGEIAEAMRNTSSAPVYADCNAISPRTAADIQGIIEGAGATFVDVGIIGAAPTRRENFPNFYTSGSGA